MRFTLKPLGAALGLAALLAGSANAQSGTASLAGWNVYGDAVSSGGALTLTTAYLDPDDASMNEAGNLSGQSAVDITVLEPAAGVPPFGLDLSPLQYATEGSLVAQSFAVGAGQTLSFDWSFATDEAGQQDPVIEDRAFVVIDGVVSTLATFSAPGSGTQGFSYTFAQGGTVSFALGVVDTIDYVGVSTLTVGNLRLGSVTAVPEPSTWALLLGGFGAAGLLARRRAR